MVGLCGPNGVGKTTLVRVLAGLHRPGGTAGCWLEGRDITGVPAARRVRLGLSTVVGQQAFGSLTVTENLRMYGYTVSRRDGRLRRAIDGAFAVFPRLYERRDQAASTLSGGERQMLVLAKTLSSGPACCSSTSSPSASPPSSSAASWRWSGRLNRLGTSLLVVEQSVNVALSLVDRAYFMEKGTIVAEHTSADLAAAARTGAVR